MITPEQFDKWFENLGRMDQMNFKTLFRVPNAKELIAKMPEGQYKDMATYFLNKTTQMIKKALGL